LNPFAIVPPVRLIDAVARRGKVNLIEHFAGKLRS
jgi:hypothetical protein